MAGRRRSRWRIRNNRGFAQVALALITGLLALAIFILALLNRVGFAQQVASFLGILIGLDVDLFLVAVQVRNPYVLIGVFAALAVFVTLIVEFNLFGWGTAI